MKILKLISLEVFVFEIKIKLNFYIKLKKKFIKIKSTYNIYLLILWISK